VERVLALGLAEVLKIKLKSFKLNSLKLKIFFIITQAQVVDTEQGTVQDLIKKNDL
jgi:hypothetical protein